MNDDLILDFDTDAGEPRKVFDPLPAGSYPLNIGEVAVVDTSTGGSQLKVTLVVEDGEHIGRKLWDRIHIRNNSEKAMKMGRDQLTGLLRAAGIPGERDMSRLINRRVIGRVKIRDDNPKYAPSNEVVSYASADEPRVVNDAPTTTPQADTRPSFLKNKG